ncbi:hypothetical protein BDN72DRAFT_963814 [Pluteus cervinus]|uniref:Uncharacterized protein n=1 Tax=Pluteus cervinus TaxID=181527 RepID=A0ACD3AD65_9AGAR|nr:hypothetical protein BDN72DRAFT_963814 [Pluteus cervinus]
MEISDNPPGDSRPPDDTGQHRAHQNSSNRNRSYHNNRSQRSNPSSRDLDNSSHHDGDRSSRSQPQQQAANRGPRQPRQPPRDQSQQEQDRPPNQGQRPRRGPSGVNTGNVEGEAADSLAPSNSGNRPRRRNRPRPPGAPSSDVSTSSAPPAPHTSSSAGVQHVEDDQHLAPQPSHGNRRRKFGAALTEASSTTPSPSTATQPQNPSDRYKVKKPARSDNGPVADDLTSSLIHTLSTPPYPDCPICFVSIHPAQPTWSCSPSIPTLPPNNMEDTSSFVPQYCWTTFHVKCIRSWANKSVKEVSDAWRARGEEKHGDWRCPGCQGKREAVPSGYWCFCHTVQDPKLTRLATPHSCGNPCARVRESGCGHPCPMQCHPGPCPPCQVTTRLQCYCPRKQIVAFKCGAERGKATRNLSCGDVCGRMLNCGKHSCDRVCHEGECGSCLVVEEVKCLCGKEEKGVLCGEGEERVCEVELPDGKRDKWVGRYTCSNMCLRPFDCGIHKCEKPCHVPSVKPETCPLSPSAITHCPCGKHRIAPLSSPTSPEYKFPARERCTSPIPTCQSICSKPLSKCDHFCQQKCHTGPCPPCYVKIVRPCRCGHTTKTIRCFELFNLSTTESLEPQEKEILCDKPCMALRACGRHQCRRICCPLASLAATAAKKGKKKVTMSTLNSADTVGVGEERGGLHECDLVCGRMLSCGNHRCEEKDHKGVCPPCLRSSFEEMICFCGRTVLEPPVPCGTVMKCTYPCPLPPPPCGHPRTQHACHEDTVSCPPCSFLATKACACGKKMVGNVKCSLETSKVSCGTVCGKLMKCGFHHCERLCHNDDCGDCTTACGKSRKLCLPSHHPCTRPCHAPSSCPEDDPCQALIPITCPCGRIKQSVHCGRCPSNPNPKGATGGSLKCTNECGIAKRNARLADALGITPESRGGDRVTYGDSVVQFAKANAKFVGVAEKAFNDFVTSDKRVQVLPHMPPERRKFVHDLAIAYRVDTQMIDQEPHRSVQLIRRVDTRVPSPLLSQYLTTLGPSVNLGKLADLRNVGVSPASTGTSTPVGGSWRSGSTSTLLAPTPSSSLASAIAAPKPMGWGSRPSNVVTPKGWTAAVAGGSGASSSPTPGRSINSTPVTAATGGSRLGSAATSKPSAVGGGSRPGSVGPSGGVHAHVGAGESQNQNQSVATGEDVDVPDDWEDDT